jgi:hypothetical protein
VMRIFVAVFLALGIIAAIQLLSIKTQEPK